MDVRTDDFLRTKISWMHRQPNFLTHGAPLRARESSAMIFQIISPLSDSAGCLRSNTSLKILQSVGTSTIGKGPRQSRIFVNIKEQTDPYGKDDEQVNKRIIQKIYLKKFAHYFDMKVKPSSGAKKNENKTKRSLQIRVWKYKNEINRLWLVRVTN